MFRREASLIVALLAAASFTGCARNELTATRTVLDTRGEAVQVWADADAWPWPDGIDARYVAVQVRVDNRSGEPLRLSRSDIQLVGGGRARAAVDPSHVVSRRLATTVGAPPNEPDEGPEAIVRFPQSRPPPRANPIAWRLALPGGPLDSGRSAQGFVYFLRRGAHFDGVSLRVILRSVVGDRALATAYAPVRH